MPIADRNSATAPKLSDSSTGDRRVTSDFSISSSIVLVLKTGSSRSISLIAVIRTAPSVLSATIRSIRECRREVLRTAISIAIQPPIEAPMSTTLSSFSWAKASR